MFASIRKIFNNDDPRSRSPDDFTFSLDEQGAAGGVEAQLGKPGLGSPVKNQTGTPVSMTSPLDIPRHPMSNARDSSKLVDSDEEEDIPNNRLVSMSCPLPGRQPIFIPRRPLVKPAAAPKAKLPNLELPPSLPKDVVFQEPPPPQQQPIDMRNLPDYALQHAASCPPAFRLIVDPQGLPAPLPMYLQVETNKLSHSPLIFDVLLSGCLHPVQHTKINAKMQEEEVSRQNIFLDHDQDHDHDELMNMKEDDELAEMEL